MQFEEKKIAGFELRKQAYQTEVERVLPKKFRYFLENQFYKKISEKTRIEELYNDQEFWEDPLNHVAFYADHGVSHVRDVSNQCLQILDIAHGVLIPKRSEARYHLVEGILLMLAYLHDIGMLKISYFGRKTHAEFASHYIYSDDFSNMFNYLWEINCGGIPWWLVNLHMKGALNQEPKQIFKEMLTLSCCHSKSLFPVELLNDPMALREKLVTIVYTDLESLFNIKEGKSSTEEAKPNEQVIRYYQGNPDSSFHWLVDEAPEMVDLRDDIIDALRVLRCSDALRMRGTAYRTSAGYEVFIDQVNANAVYAIRTGHMSKLTLVSVENPLNAGEANIASCELGTDGHLRVSFNRGYFTKSEKILKAANDVAIVIHDIIEDTFRSFVRLKDENYPRMVAKPKMKSSDMKIFLEKVDDYPSFTEFVKQNLVRIEPDLNQKCFETPSFQQAEPYEIERYMAGEEILVDDLQVQQWVENIRFSGHQLEGCLDDAFNDCRVVKLRNGEVLIEAGGESGFVYVPLQKGLLVYPWGGVTAIDAQSFVPIGNTGVIRGGERNATVIAKEDISLIMIPSLVYLEHWYLPYSPNELGDALRPKT